MPSPAGCTTQQDTAAVSSTHGVSSRARWRRSQSDDDERNRVCRDCGCGSWRSESSTARGSNASCCRRSPICSTSAATAQVFVVRLRAYWGVSKAMAICALADVYHQARPTLWQRCKAHGGNPSAGHVRGHAAVAEYSVRWQEFADGRSADVLATSIRGGAPGGLLLCRHTRAMANVAASLAAGHLRHVDSLHTRHADLDDDDRAARESSSFRSSLAERLTALGRGSALAPPGPAEWTFTDLLDRAAGTSPTDQALARKQLTSRLTTATLPIMLGFLALGISGYSRKIAIFSGVWVLVLYFAALRAAAPSSYRAPSIESVWLVNALFALAGLWLVWIRPRPDDTGSETHITAP